MSKEEYGPKSVVRESAGKIQRYKTASMVSFCKEVIEEYSLETMLKNPKELIFEKLSDAEKEKLCAGMIKLGEALTYCRDSAEAKVQNTGISELAINYVRVRNHFVHHHMYHDDKTPFTYLNELAHSVGPMEYVIRSLASLENCGIEMLSKESGKGKNNFQFEYPHFVTCLKRESILLDKSLAELKGQEKIPFEKKICLENRVRNILMILVDLLDEKRDGKRSNTNFGDPCEEQKQFVATLNEKYKKEKTAYKDFFDVLKAKRNLLCHLEADQKKPYANDKEQIEFAEGLDDLLKNGYVETLEKGVIVAQREVPKIEILGPVETQRKTKTKAKPPLLVVEAVKPKISGLEHLKKAYNVPEGDEKPSSPESKDAEKPVSEPEKKKEKKGSPGVSPRMGGMK